MAYFIPLGVQKRLLRYALSRLELLDTDQLDLDKFDISLGKKSTINLEDVAIRIEKLSTLLHLPNRVQLLHARVLKLRVVVPADIYSTGIAVHVDGVVACAKLVREYQEDSQPHGKGAVEKEKPETTTSTKARRRSEEDTNDGSGNDEYIPTAADLAKSFIQEEGIENKEIKDDLVSRSRSLQDPNAMQESVLETNEEGTGIALSMPGFLTNFLQGIVDRLQVAVENVQLTLQAEVEFNDRSNNGRKEAPLSIIMRIKEIDVGPLSSIAQQAARQMQLIEISGSLVCDADVLANISRISSPLSPISTRSPESSLQRVPTESAQYNEVVDRNELAKTDEGLRKPLDKLESSSQVADINASPEWSGQQLSESALLEESILTNDSDRFADATKNMSLRQKTSREPISLFTGSSRPSSSQFDDAEGAGYYEKAGTPTQSFPKTESSSARSSQAAKVLSSSNTSQLSKKDGPTNKSFSTITPQQDLTLGSKNYFESSMKAQKPPQAQLKNNDDSSNSGSSSNNEDLAHSMLFSHEEAASMYYSISSEMSRKRTIASSIADADAPRLRKEEPVSEDKIDDASLGASESAVTGSRSKSGEGHRISADDDKIMISDDDISDGQNAVKPVMSIDMVILDIAASRKPSQNEEVVSGSSMQPLESGILNSGIEQDIPGAFSQYAEAGNRRNRRGSTVHAPRVRKPNPDAVQETEPVKDTKNRGSSQGSTSKLKIGTISIEIDMSRGRLLYEVLNQLSSSISSKERPETPRELRSSSESDTSAEISVDNITICLVGESTDPTSDTFNRDGNERLRYECGGTALLKATAKKLTMLSHLTSSSHQVDLSVFDFRLAFDKEDIVSFDAKARMRTSVRDLREPQANALNCSLLLADNRTDIQVSTLPVLISLDIHEIDDFLGACGGVDSIIELGTSISSNSTIQRLSQAERQQAKHLKSHDHLSDKHQSSALVKFNARFAGSLVTLRGRSCAMAAKTSAVKLVCRSGNLAIQVDEVDISNPQAELNLESTTLIHLTNNRVQFLFVPEEDDLDQLVALVAPSKGGYENNDDVLLDTLLAQRKRGTLLRTTTSVVKLEIPHLKVYKLFQSFGEELAKLKAVKRYLPAESRPGMLSLVSIEQFDIKYESLDNIGSIDLHCQKLCVAYIALPSLLALSVGMISAKYQNSTDLVHEVPGSSILQDVPMFLACYLGDDLESTLKMKLNNLCCEYSIHVIMAITKFIEESSSVDNDHNAEVSSLTETENASAKSFTKHSSHENIASFPHHVLKLNVLIQNCGVGLNPLSAESKGLFILTNAKLTMDSERDGKVSLLDVSKASLLVIDKVSNIKDEASEPWIRIDAIDKTGAKHIECLCNLGYVSVSTISSAKALVRISDCFESSTAHKSIDVDLKDELFVLETCADSTQTMLEVLNGLKLPSKPSKDARFRTEVVPMQDMMASFSGDAFTDFGIARNSAPAQTPEGILPDDASSEDLEFTESLYDLETVPFSENVDDEFLDNGLESLESLPAAYNLERRPETDNPRSMKTIDDERIDLDFREDYFDTQVGAIKSGQVHYDTTTDDTDDNIQDHLKSPLKVKLNDIHIIWNLYDGFDWPGTRETIAIAVNDLEVKADERRKKREKYREPEEEEPVIGDYLFNSIWIDIPPHKNPRDIYGQVNRDVNDRASETESHTTSALSSSPSRVSKPRVKSKRLRLGRGRHHKVTFELKGVSADIVTYTPGVSETQSLIDIRVMDFEVFDHVPTSTWKKFATYMHDAGEREMGKPMIRLEIQNVKPVPDLAASELVLRMSILPLRLHVDQDALDFIIRFFEFKSKEDKMTMEKQEEIFLQRVEINEVVLKLDYKPKKVDYTGLHSGHTTELMNFFILDGSDITLRHAIIYGVSGFDKLHKTLNDIWMPDVKRNQLPGVLAGLAPVRSLANVGGGVRDLVVIPIKEYRKDGRIVRSIRKGALAFAKTTTSELARFGAKLAIGTQNVLQGTEDMLAGPAERGPSGQQWDVEADDYASPASDALKIPLPPTTTTTATSLSSSPSSGSKPTRAVSNYADQPIGVLAGLRGAARSLERDLLTARDAVIAIQGEVMESDSAGSAAKVVARRAPTVILRPAIGASKAVGMTLLGAGNALDKNSRRRIDDKYKRV